MVIIDIFLNYKFETIPLSILTKKFIEKKSVRTDTIYRKNV